MDNIFERPDIITMEALVILEDELKDFRNNITDVLDCPGLKIYDENEGVIPGTHHFKLTAEVTARDCALSIKLFTEQIIKPAIMAIADAMKKLKGEYAFLKLPLDKDRVCSFSIDRNLGIRMVKGYDIRTHRTIIKFDIALIEIKEFR